MALIRTSNPALNARTFADLRRDPTAPPMTLEGTVNKAAFLLFLVVVPAAWVWSQVRAALDPSVAAPWIMLGAIGGLVEAKYPGIVMQSVGLTFATLAAMLVAYRTGLIKATEKFKLGVVAATGAIVLYYLVGWVLSWFHVAMPFLQGNGTASLVVSGIIVVVAALNLILDFDFIETGVAGGAPKYMEWYGAFGLMVTLIWLYLEILRLLAKSRSRR